MASSLVSTERRLLLIEVRNEVELNEWKIEVNVKRARRGDLVLLSNQKNE